MTAEERAGRTDCKGRAPGSGSPVALRQWPESTPGGGLDWHDLQIVPTRSKRKCLVGYPRLQSLAMAGRCRQAFRVGASTAARAPGRHTFRSLA